MLGIVTKKEKQVNHVLMVPIEKVFPNPQQPRHRFDGEALLSLAQSIRQNGILQPLTVRMGKKGEYELIAGERRLRAAIMAGFSHVPCITVDLDDRQAAIMALIENLQREDLDFFEEAEGMEKLLETCGLTQDELAQRLGKNQSTVANKLRLLRLSGDDREQIVSANLTERHARALLRLDERRRSQALQVIIKRQLNVLDTDRLVDTLAAPRKPRQQRKTKTVIKDVRIFVNTIANAIDVMKKSGIDAVTRKSENEDFIEYVVKIPKQSGVML